MVFEAALESEIKHEGLDFKEIVTYLAINLSEWQARKARIWKLIPKRKFKSGQKPTIRGESALSATSKHDAHWKYSKLEFSDDSSDEEEIASPKKNKLTANRDLSHQITIDFSDSDIDSDGE